MLVGAAILLVIIWAVSFLAFHVAGGLIHLLLVFAVVSFIVHLFTGGKDSAATGQP